MFTACIERGPSEGARARPPSTACSDGSLMSLACAGGEHRGSTALPDPTLSPLPQPLNITLVLDHNETCHQHGEQSKGSRRSKRCSKDGKESKGSERTEE